MISEYFLLSLMLSIQYVYERVLLIFSPFELSFSKRLQKYNFFLNPQAFSKKNFFFFLSSPILNLNTFSELPNLPVWEGKDKIFFPQVPKKISTFFRLFLTLIIRSKMRFMFSMCVAVLAAAKVSKFFKLPNLFSSFFYFPFYRNPFIHKG